MSTGASSGGDLPDGAQLNIARYYTPYSTPQRTRPYDTDGLISLVGLTEQRNSVIARLSGGQRRRLDVAVGNPDLLFPGRTRPRVRPAGPAGFPRRGTAAV